ncbi:MAG: hydrogenase expression/formation protein HypE [candidate division KSB1 bacterium]|jgi:hydrogenase expression/formation protein HypE|nr:hydrogenase expression/formation protein HypE [candidate division KSB1 bacterium]
METDKILLDHGSGGRASHRLIADLILNYFGNDLLNELDDSVSLQIGESRLAFSTDSYTVDPVFFPGGNIGHLAVNGTVNDVAMKGAQPLYLSVAFIIEEGFPMSDFERILTSMKECASEAGVQIVTGDTKVVPVGSADGIFINTSGIGAIPDHVNISGSNAQPGDQIILSGSIADHGVTVLTQRQGLSFSAPLTSDSAPLNGLVQSMLQAGKEIHVLRDPTRGGVATTLNEIAGQSDVGINIYEDRIKVRPAVAAACEMLGLDPLYIANEGKLLAFVASAECDAVLQKMRTQKYGADAEVIGEVSETNRGRVIMKTTIGGSRIVDMLTGEQLPRIC